MSVLEQGSKETAETDTERQKARAELELVYKGKGLIYQLLQNSHRVSFNCKEP